MEFKCKAIEDYTLILSKFNYEMAPLFSLVRDKKVKLLHCNNICFGTLRKSVAVAYAVTELAEVIEATG